MDDVLFNSLSKEQLFEGFALCRENARVHMSCAQLMFDKKRYGIANSHLILGAEEAIKAALLLAKHFNIDPQIKSITPYFRRHEVKHAKGKKMDEGYKIIIPIINGIRALIEKDGLSLFKNVFRLIIPNESQEWWDGANEQKNKGFYLDYSDGHWQSPQSFSAENYLESKRAIQDIIDMLEFTKSLKVDDYKLIPDERN
jgi:AbiV family abortive infection protein